MLRLLRDEALARRLGDGLRRRAVEEFSWDAGGERIIGVYEQLLAGDSPA
jgi:glycosyltransferase involved in cell wall biosynthesis